MTIEEQAAANQAQAQAAAAAAQAQVQAQVQAQAQAQVAAKAKASAGEDDGMIARFRYNQKAEELRAAAARADAAEARLKELEGYKAPAEYQTLTERANKAEADLRAARIESTLLQAGVDVDEEVTAFLVERFEKATEDDFPTWFEGAKDKGIVKRILAEAADHEEDSADLEYDEDVVVKPAPRRAKVGQKVPSSERGIRGRELAKMTQDDYAKQRVALLGAKRTARRRR